MYSQKY